MPVITESEKIQGVLKVEFRKFGDERGAFQETFRSEWFPHVDWSKIQMNRSDSAPNVLRGLHYHFKQLDYWYVQDGVIRVGLADLRPSSPTFKAVDSFDMGGEGNDFGLLIPIGVGHGFCTLTEVTHTYLVNNYYDSNDEFGVAWDDPDLGVDWGVADPILSPRDINNPRLKDVPADIMPK